MTVCSRFVISYKLLASKGLDVEVSRVIAHSPFVLVSLLDIVPCKVLFAIPRAAVAFLEVVEVNVQIHLVVHDILRSLSYISLKSLMFLKFSAVMKPSLYQ